MKALGDEALTNKVLEDYSTAPVSEPLRAMLGFLETLTLDPSAIRPEDARELLALGLSRQAIQDAIYVCYLFCTYDRLADTLGWHVPVAAAFEASANHLLKRGYG